MNNRKGLAPQLKEQIRILELIWSGKGTKRAILSVVTMALLLQAVLLIQPRFVQFVLDDVINKSNYSLLNVLALGFVLTLIMAMLFGSLKDVLLISAATKIKRILFPKVYAHLLSLPLTFFAEKSSGDLYSRFMGLHPIQEALSKLLPNLIINALYLLPVLMLMAHYNPLLALVSFALYGFHLALRVKSANYLQRYNHQVQTLSSDQSRSILESIRHLRAIKIFQMEHVRHAQWLARFEAKMSIDNKVAILNMAVRNSQELIIGLDSIVTLYMGVHYILSGTLTTGMLFAFIGYKVQMFMAIRTLADGYTEFRLLQVYVARLKDILNVEGTVNDDLLTQSTTRNNCLTCPAIHIRNLSFKYPGDDKYIVKDFCLDIRAGESLALIGPSGCGKTTIINCIAGLYSMHQGEIHFIGEGYSGAHGYLRSLAVIFQDDVLMEGTILQNITGFKKKYDFAKVVEVAVLANIHEEILAMKNGYDMAISDLDVSFSGGQMQRILIARALYKDPRILILDEATSQLDERNERIIIENLQLLPITKILISHRSQVHMLVDRVVNLPA